MVPSDKDARNKYELTLKEFRLREFSKCIEVEDKRVEVNLEDIIVEASYSGPTITDIEEVNTEWVLKYMEYMKDSKVLHRKYATMILLKVRDIFEAEKNVVSISIPDDEDITVCGDVHG